MVTIPPFLYALFSDFRFMSGILVLAYGFTMLTKIPSGNPEIENDRAI